MSTDHLSFSLISREICTLYYSTILLERCQASDFKNTFLPCCVLFEFGYGMNGSPHCNQVRIGINSVYLTCINASKPPSGLSIFPEIGAFLTRSWKCVAFGDKLI